MRADWAMTTESFSASRTPSSATRSVPVPTTIAASPMSENVLHAGRQVPAKLRSNALSSFRSQGFAGSVPQ